MYVSTAAKFGMASQYRAVKTDRTRISGLDSYLGSSKQNETTHLTQLSGGKKTSITQKNLKSQKINHFTLESSSVYCDMK